MKQAEIKANALYQICEVLKKENDRLKREKEAAILLAIEWGYKQCEKGENLEATFINYHNLKTTKP